LLRLANGDDLHVLSAVGEIVDPGALGPRQLNLEIEPGRADRRARVSRR
jgi:hypothetical protein